MLIAIDEQGVHCFAQKAEKNRKYICPACQENVWLKKGKKKRAHFSHGKQANCTTFSEAESQEHLYLKGVFYEWLMASGMSAALEAYLPGLRQRPDLLSGRLVLEIQCSDLPYLRFLERTQNYSANNYLDWWILGTAFFQQNQLRQIEKSFCSYNEKRGLHFWQADAKTKQLRLIHHVEETVTGRLDFRCTSWSFFSSGLKNILSGNIDSYEEVFLSNKRNLKAWLQQQLYRKQKRVLQVQGQCYLQGDHLLYLSSWIYQESRFFFYFRESVFFYRLLFEKTREGTRSLHFARWQQEIKRYKEEWSFPMIEEQVIFSAFFDECCRLYNG